MVSRLEVFILEGSSKRMDIIVWVPCSQKWYDATIVNLLCPTYVVGSSKAPGFASSTRAEAKRLKYNGIAKSKNTTFTPLVFEVSGRFDEEVKNLLLSLAHHKSNSYIGFMTGQARARMVSDAYMSMTQQLSCALSHCNTIIINEAILKSSRPGYNADKLYKGLKRKIRNM